MLHLGKVENERHSGNEDEVEDAHRGEKVSHLSEVGAAQEHLQKHLSEKNSPAHTNQCLYWCWMVWSNLVES